MRLKIVVFEQIWRRFDNPFRFDFCQSTHVHLRGLDHFKGHQPLHALFMQRAGRKNPRLLAARHQIFTDSVGLMRHKRQQRSQQSSMNIGILCCLLIVFAIRFKLLGAYQCLTNLSIGRGFGRRFVQR